jgi:hypothetical protein
MLARIIFGLVCLILAGVTSGLLAVLLFVAGVLFLVAAAVAAL